MHNQIQKAVVLFSGGLDSLATLAQALHEGREVHPVAFDYGQRALRRELTAARCQLRWFNWKGFAIRELRIVKISGLLGDSSALLNSSMPLDKGDMTVGNGYVPARNLMMLTMAGSLAEGLGCEEIWAGLLYANIDAGDTPDSTPQFVEAVEIALRRGTQVGRRRPMRIECPYIRARKTDVILAALRNEAPIELSWSCLEGGTRPCGDCSACLTRAVAFLELGIVDPALCQHLLAGRKLM